MNNGIIYPIINFLIEKIKYLNIVELFKYVALKFNANKKDASSAKSLTRIASDIYILLKWLLVLLLWNYKIANSTAVLISWYLIVSNLYTYFYYHIWDNESLDTDNFSISRIKRRFINLIMALCFSTICFAYLFNIPYAANFSWPKDHANVSASIMYSFSNSLAANYEEVKPTSGFGNIISSIQLLITFSFITIILSKTLPQTNSTNL